MTVPQQPPHTQPGTPTNTARTMSPVPHGGGPQLPEGPASFDPAISAILDHLLCLQSRLTDIEDELSAVHARVEEALP